MPRARPVDPTTSVPADVGKFVVSSVGDLDGDGVPAIVCAVTRHDGECYLLAYRPSPNGWQRERLAPGWDDVTLVRTISLGDLDGDGRDEIVLGARPNGSVIVMSRSASGYAGELVDRDQCGPCVTNTREVVVGDADGDGRPEILVATARADADKWQATPGSVFAHRRVNGGWERVLIDDHGDRTHSRMVAVADVLDDGVPRVITSAVGVLEPDSSRVALEPEVRMHTWRNGVVTTEPIAILHGMIKSRSFAVGDIDGDGHSEIVVGTRALGYGASIETALYAFRVDRARGSWTAETLDRSGPLGFHAVTVGDVDGDGRLAVIASDDGRGCVKVYRKRQDAWQAQVIYTSRTEIFCSAIHIIDGDPHHRNGPAGMRTASHSVRSR